MALFLTYFIWSLLPTVLLVSYVKGKFREVTKARNPGKRHGDLLKSGTYCLIILVACIAFNEFFFADFLDKQLKGIVPAITLNWLLYPLVIFILSALEDFFNKKPETSMHSKYQDDSQRVRFIQK